ncbi:MAG: hypothetical protein P4L99_19060 [Chthoniobacter sp.]|nr:hypothetical protein [Chthoniobacter sp.]
MTNDRRRYLRFDTFSNKAKRKNLTGAPLDRESQTSIPATAVPALRKSHENQSQRSPTIHIPTSVDGRLGISLT